VGGFAFGFGQRVDDGLCGFAELHGGFYTGAEVGEKAVDVLRVE
jgi:hypothetical protein